LDQFARRSADKAHQRWLHIFLEAGIYASTGRIQQIFKCCGDNDALTTAWDWTRAFSTHAVYTVINPQAHPTSAGFSFKSHITVRIFSADGTVPEAPAELTASTVSSGRGGDNSLQRCDHGI